MHLINLNGFEAVPVAKFSKFWTQKTSYLCSFLTTIPPGELGNLADRYLGARYASHRSNSHNQNHIQSLHGSEIMARFLMISITIEILPKHAKNMLQINDFALPLNGNSFESI